MGKLKFIALKFIENCLKFSDLAAFLPIDVPNRVSCCQNLLTWKIPRIIHSMTFINPSLSLMCRTARYFNILLCIHDRFDRRRDRRHHHVL